MAWLHYIAMGMTASPAPASGAHGPGVGGVSTGEAFAIGVPLIIFVLGEIATGVMLLVKSSAYMARSAAAQESTFGGRWTVRLQYFCGAMGG